ncbi:hypothetical protein EST44_26775 [Escherichia coli]|nr:hypothetical protein [Escherichia coli]
MNVWIPACAGMTTGGVGGNCGIGGIGGLKPALQPFSTQYGNFEVRESLFASPSGNFVKFETTYQVLPNGTRVFNTVIPKGGQ